MEKGRGEGKERKGFGDWVGEYEGCEKGRSILEIDVIIFGYCALYKFKLKWIWLIYIYIYI